jgi:hypothetical protein
VSYVWCLSGFLNSEADQPPFGNVHLGRVVLVEGSTQASGMYLPGPTTAGVDIRLARQFYVPLSLQYPNVYFGSFGFSGQSPG